MKKKILLVGANGKMGKVVAEKLKTNYDIVEFDINSRWFDFGVDLVVDFGSAESSVLSAKYCLKYHIPLIVGSTGQSQNEIEKIREVSKYAALVICGNFSVGVYLLKRCINQILSYNIDDICIFEKHHKNKKDSPSGTAIMLENYIKNRYKSNIQVLTERGGEEIGTHMLDFYFSKEKIAISHQAFSRESFAEGVLIAVDYILKTKEKKEFNFDYILEDHLFKCEWQNKNNYVILNAEN